MSVKWIRELLSEGREDGRRVMFVLWRSGDSGTHMDSIKGTLIGILTGFWWCTLYASHEVRI